MIDTHSHLYVEDYDADRDEVIARAVAAGAKKLLQPNVDEKSIEPMMKLCAQYPDLCLPMMGLHPTEVPENQEDTKIILDKMEKLLDEGNFVAVGEVGLDFYWDKTNIEGQIAAFVRQIEWAVKYDLPLMIHSRAAHRELVNTLLPYEPQLRKGGVFHCYSGSLEETRELMRKFPKFVFGIGGVVTFKNCKLGDVLKQEVPLDRIVLETDAPWLAPTPHRGTRNESAYIPLIIKKLAEVYDCSEKEVEEVTDATASFICTASKPASCNAPRHSRK